MLHVRAVTADKHHQQSLFPGEGPKRYLVPRDDIIEFEVWRGRAELKHYRFCSNHENLLEDCRFRIADLSIADFGFRISDFPTIRNPKSEIRNPGVSSFPVYQTERDFSMRLAPIVLLVFTLPANADTYERQP